MSDDRSDDRDGPETGDVSGVSRAAAAEVGVVIGSEELKSLYQSLDRNGDNTVHLEDVVHFVSDKYDQPPEVVSKAAERWLQNITSNGRMDYDQFEK